jgi:hypothetical protein
MSKIKLVIKNVWLPGQSLMCGPAGKQRSTIETGEFAWAYSGGCNKGGTNMGIVIRGISFIYEIFTTYFETDEIQAQCLVS